MELSRRKKQIQHGGVLQSHTCLESDGGQIWLLRWLFHRSVNLNDDENDNAAREPVELHPEADLLDVPA